MHTEPDFGHLYFVFLSIIVLCSKISNKPREASCIQAELLCKTSPPVFFCFRALEDNINVYVYTEKRKNPRFFFCQMNNFAWNSLVLNSADLLSPPGTLNHLKETFTHTPSYDMSPAMLSMLIRLMLAQAQECLFEKIALPGIRNQFSSLIKMAQEAAKVFSLFRLQRV